MTIAIYWFRNDLRLQDNPALLAACGTSDFLLPIYIHQAHLEAETQWGFQRVSQVRKLFLRESLNDLTNQLQSQNSNLFEFNSNVLDVFQALQREHGQIKIYCERIAAPEEKIQIRELREAGFEVHDIWQSSMLDLIDMPFELEDMPDIFTQFRQKIEKAGLRFAEPVRAPKNYHHFLVNQLYRRFYTMKLMALTLIKHLLAERAVQKLI